MKHRCPICKKIIEVTEQEKAQDTDFFPFCSHRCKLIDLGVWIDGEYKVISKLPDESSEISDDWEVDKCE